MATPLLEMLSPRMMSELNVSTPHRNSSRIYTPSPSLGRKTNSPPL